MQYEYHHISIPEPLRNFHNIPPLRLRIDTEKIKTIEGNKWVSITEGQKARILNHFCPYTLCLCHSGYSILFLDDNETFVRLD